MILFIDNKYLLVCLIFLFYKCREYCESAHFTVNHSIEFVNTITGACTNEIEGLWTLSKMHCPNFNHHRPHFEGELFLNITRLFFLKLFFPFQGTWRTMMSNAILRSIKTRLQNSFAEVVTVGYFWLMSQL